eukprot:6031555-Alexandrium_andersonii.AAC.1
MCIRDRSKAVEQVSACHQLGCQDCAATDTLVAVSEESGEAPSACAVLGAVALVCGEPSPRGEGCCAQSASLELHPAHEWALRNISLRCIL